jgi:hypothetical protein
MFIIVEVLAIKAIPNQTVAIISSILLGIYSISVMFLIIKSLKARKNILNTMLSSFLLNPSMLDVDPTPLSYSQC